MSEHPPVFAVLRGISESDLWKNQPKDYLRIWIFLLEQARWQPEPKVFRPKNGVAVTIHRGELFIGQPTLAERCQVGRQVVRNALRLWSESRQIHVRIATKSGSVITICNYNKYQLSPKWVQPTPQPTGNQPATTSEESKKVRTKNIGLFGSLRSPLKPHPNPTRKAARTSGALPGFERWWKTYPSPTACPNRKHQGKGKAGCLKLWKAANLEQQADELIEILQAWKRSPDWQKDQGAYVPAAVVFLNSGSHTENPVGQICPVESQHRTNRLLTPEEKAARAARRPQ